MPTPWIKDRTVTLPQTYSGVYLAKDWIDMFDPTRSRHERITSGSRWLRRIARAAGQSSSLSKPRGDTGGRYWQPCPSPSGHAACVNTRQALEFACATGRLAKKDRFDAQVLAEKGTKP